MENWGDHLIIDAAGCDVAKVRSKEDADAFIKALVPFIEMKAYGDPFIQRFAEHSLDLVGITLLQPIETSSITCHYCDKDGDLYLDIFSCKKVPILKTIDFFVKWYNPEKLKYLHIERDAKKLTGVTYWSEMSFR